MKQEPQLLNNNLAFSIIHRETGELLDSRPRPTPHDDMVRESLGWKHSEEEVVRVITHIKKGKRIWELRHDIDGYMRRNGLWAEQDYQRALRVAAQTLIRLGASPSDLVSCDNRLLTETKTLDELAQQI
jgi:hypothetical protein